MIRHRSKTAAAEPVFRRCPGCSYDFLTGEGTRTCEWYSCPYLPPEWDVFCPECNYDFVTGEGNSRCSDPPSCDYAVAGYKRAEVAKTVAGLTP